MILSQTDQDEQHELRDELGDQLRERSDLMAQLAHQALSDTEQNSEILQRIAKLSEVSFFFFFTLEPRVE